LGIAVALPNRLGRCGDVADAENCPRETRLAAQRYLSGSLREDRRLGVGCASGLRPRQGVPTTWRCTSGLAECFVKAGATTRRAMCCKMPLRCSQVISDLGLQLGTSLPRWKSANRLCTRLNEFVAIDPNCAAAHEGMGLCLQALKRSTPGRRRASAFHYFGRQFCDRLGSPRSPCSTHLDGLRNRLKRWSVPNNSSQTTPRLLYLIGRNQVHSGRLLDALASLDGAVALDPNHADSWYERAAAASPAQTA